MTDAANRAQAGSDRSGRGESLAGRISRRRKYRMRRRTYCLQSVVQDHLREGGSGSDGARLAGELAEAQEELRQAREAALRARADLENQRRRHQKEKADLRKFATEDLVSSLVPAMDHFALALQSLQTATDMDSVRKGVEMIHREFANVLNANGLEEISPGGKPFDPSQHEAAATESKEGEADGVVLEVLRPGWSLRGRVLRPALVKVNKADKTDASQSCAAT